MYLIIYRVHRLMFYSDKSILNMEANENLLLAFNLTKAILVRYAVHKFQ